MDSNQEDQTTCVLEEEHELAWEEEGNRCSAQKEGHRKVLDEELEWQVYN